MQLLAASTCVVVRADLREEQRPRCPSKGDLVDSLSPWFGFVIPLAYPVYVLLMAGVLHLCGVKKTEIAKWALKQAGRQRFTDLISAARGLLPDEPNKDDGAKATELGRTPQEPDPP